MPIFTLCRTTWESPNSQNAPLEHHPCLKLHASYTLVVYVHGKTPAMPKEWLKRASQTSFFDLCVCLYTCASQDPPSKRCLVGHLNSLRGPWVCQMGSFSCVKSSIHLVELGVAHKFHKLGGLRLVLSPVVGCKLEALIWRPIWMPTMAPIVWNF